MSMQEHDWINLADGCRRGKKAKEESALRKKVTDVRHFDVFFLNLSQCIYR